MKISRSNVATGAIALAMLAAGTGIPALGQDRQDSQDAPESLLPPGFGEPDTGTPAPQPTRAPQPQPTAIVQPVPTPTAAPGRAAEPTPTPSASPTLSTVDYSQYELPPFARRSTARVGTVAYGNPPFARDSFGNADGRYLRTLMRRLDAPIASRWLSIALRRALMSRIDTPANISGADFAAERAWLLLRMGEANGARMLVQSIDSADYSPALMQVGLQVALANADPAAVCPYADRGAEILPARGWVLAQAMCAGMAGRSERAGELVREGSRGAGRNNVDTLLAEKVIAMGASGARAVTIEWDGVDHLTTWRYGLAMAGNVEIPEALMRGVRPQVRAWYALSPHPDPAARVAAAEQAATTGVFSNAGLVDLYSEVSATEDGNSAELAAARDLRSAYTAASAADRVEAMRSLWDAPASARGRYARLILTARASGRLPANEELVEDADSLIASMLSAGLTSQATGWRDIVARGSDGWAMLTLADVAPAERYLSYGDADSYRGTADTRKARLFLAGLAGLGRLEADDAQRMAAALDVRIGESNAWTREIDAAGQRGDAGSVVLLAALGMQSYHWAAVTPEALFHIVAALRAAGMENYARMIAVEAITRA
ncbi:hypothetical protein [Stakelama tenebrarum]|uniref:Uncharacterized protein n=1 Tax=Stakelama tenebrarum TaxID=2711215 RepID=A0A6G6Y7V3_9SPHN|nr:hypothetical protein [Sphingosinithalassobacter tenebrarum]QIG81022.1 hypothetical protein G5C33_15320 [Sphingosinithalassobacter tenebrarum]